MTKESYFETTHCESRLNCKACRTNQQFRKQLTEHFILPDIDFNCPFGITVFNLTEKEKVELPSMREQFKNLSSAAGRAATAAVKGEKLKVSKEIYDGRIAICKACDKFIEDSLRCQACGCQLKFKAILATESCPEGKWSCQQ
ncbi:MAG: hypothetical protein HRT89_15685 [Lentisphaeria bacterium]|nr:DUF6171 family protein [Lentisphaeria bacterium]NQZ69499.1 hypothetical protein [Lentisphaeria bacterium]